MRHHGRVQQSLFDKWEIQTNKGFLTTDFTDDTDKFHLLSVTQSLKFVACHDDFGRIRSHGNKPSRFRAVLAAVLGGISAKPPKSRRRRRPLQRFLFFVPLRAASCLLTISVAARRAGLPRNPRSNLVQPATTSHSDSQRRGCEKSNDKRRIPNKLQMPSLKSQSVLELSPRVCRDVAIANTTATGSGALEANFAHSSFAAWAWKKIDHIQRECAKTIKLITTKTSGARTERFARYSNRSRASPQKKPSAAPIAGRVASINRTPDHPPRKPKSSGSP